MASSAENRTASGSEVAAGSGPPLLGIRRAVVRARVGQKDLVLPLSMRRKLRLSVEVLVTYTRVRWWLRRHEVREVVRRLRDGQSVMQPASPESAPGQAEYESALRLGRAASRTLRLLPTDGRCLMRSLVLTGLLARRGISSTLIIGVRPEPEFSAHAWVEHGGRPLLPSGGSDYYGRLAEM